MLKRTKLNFCMNNSNRKEKFIFQKKKKNLKQIQSLGDHRDWNDNSTPPPPPNELLLWSRHLPRWLYAKINYSEAYHDTPPSDKIANEYSNSPLPRIPSVYEFHVTITTITAGWTGSKEAGGRVPFLTPFAWSIVAGNKSGESLSRPLTRYIFVLLARRCLQCSPVAKEIASCDRWW